MLCRKATVSSNQVLTSLFMLDLQIECTFIPVGNFLKTQHFSIGAGRQACNRKSHWDCPSRASERGREQGFFPLGFTIVESCVFKQLPSGKKIHLDLQFYIAKSAGILLVFNFICRDVNWGCQSKIELTRKCLQ